MQNKMSKLVWMWLLLVMITLSGCSSVSPSAEELLRAPALSGDYNEIRTVLMAQFDNTVQLKYPTEGELLSPFIFGDWDGDGKEEAVVLFTIEQSPVVVVGILKQDEENRWQIKGVSAGLSNTVNTIEFASMKQTDAQQIVVTFQAQGEQYLAVYLYQDSDLVCVFQQPYSQYLIEDITGTGTDDLILITSNDVDAVQLELITFEQDGFTQTVIPSFNEVPFTGYLNISTSAGRADCQYLLIDGFVGEGQTTVVTEMIWYNPISSKFEQLTVGSVWKLYQDSRRYSADLISQDVDGDGALEVPIPYNVQDGILNHIQGSPVSLIEWIDFADYKAQKGFGLFDDEYDYYLALPDEVKGNLLLMDGKDGAIEVRNLSGDLLYFSLRVVDFEQTDPDWYQIGMVASQQIQVKIGEEASSFLSVYTLSRGVHLL